MHAMRRWLLAGMMGIVAVTVTVAVTPSEPVWGAPPCRASTCDGLNPVAAGCTADAYAVGGADFPDPDSTLRPAALDIYYSPGCQTAWGEFNTTANNQVQLNFIAELEYGGPAYYLPAPAVTAGAGSYDTAMSLWSQSFQFCANEGAAVSACTTWR
jgi:hypothetical protein